MQIPKFKEFFVEQDLERKSKPITVAIITIADSDDPKENTCLLYTSPSPRDS